MGISIETIIKRGLLQASGMKKYADAAKGSPFDAANIEQRALSLQTKKTRQDTLKIELQELTEEITTESKTYDLDVSRNVSHFDAAWGKFDKRLEEIGGRCLEKRHPHHEAKETAKS